MIFGMFSIIWDIFLKCSGGKIFFRRKSPSLASKIFNTALPEEITDFSKARPSLSKRRQEAKLPLGSLASKSEGHQIAHVFLSVIETSMADGNFLSTEKSLNLYFPAKNSSISFCERKNTCSLGTISPFLQAIISRIIPRNC